MRVLVLLAILGSAVAVPRSIQRIVGGNDTNAETYPFMVSMQYGWWGIIWQQACGGSLITPNTVLTAAHCTEGDQPSDWRLVMGSSFRNGTGGVMHAVARIIIHHDYDNFTALDADYCLLHLANSAVLTDTVQTISILSSTTTIPTGLPVTAIGFGATSYQGPASERLQHVDKNIIEHALCKAIYDELRTRPGFAGWPQVTDYMICSGSPYGGKDACQGDSGGPVVYKLPNSMTVVGVVSWGYECALATHPGVLGSMPPATNWVVANSV